jgi:hypothetical protein
MSAITDRSAALASAVAAYGTATVQLLADVADQIGVSLAYVDRRTVEAHLERRLTAAEWAAVNGSFRALDLDDHLDVRDVADWIDAVLVRAEVAGRLPSDDPDLLVTVAAGGAA